MAWLLFAVVLPTATWAEPSSDLEALLLSYIEVWNSRETDRLEELVTADFARYAGPGEATRSRAELENLILQTHDVWSHLDMTIEDQLVVADRGAIRGGFSGVHRSVNRLVQFQTMSLFRFADGLIAEEWIIGDNFMTLMALGYELVPPGFEAIPPASGQEADTPPEAGDRTTDGR